MFIYFVIFSALFDALTMLDSIITILFSQKLKTTFHFFWMRWFFALAAISGLAQGETCVTLDSTRYYYRRMESNRAEIQLRLEHDSSRNVLKTESLFVLKSGNPTELRENRIYGG